MKGLGGWFKADALDKWNHLTRKMTIIKDSPGTFDFFEGSEIFYGSYRKHQSIAAIYNPWIDGILILLLDNSGEASLVEDFVLISGESWRGQKIANPLLLLMPGKEPTSVRIWRNFALTKEIFLKFYPEEAEVKTLPLPKVNTANEIEVINARIALRFKLIAVFLGEKYVYAKKQAAIVKALITIRDPEKIELGEFFAQSQNKVVLGSFFHIPLLVRQDMKLYAFVPGKDNALLIFINPYVPRYVVSVEVNKNKKPTLEWYDLFQSGVLYKSWLR